MGFARLCLWKGAQIAESALSCGSAHVRHTYATHMLKGLLERKSSKFEPLMYLQARLGHSSITTTMKYLHLVNDLVDDLSIEYQQQIDAIV